MSRFPVVALCLTFAAAGCVSEKPAATSETKASVDLGGASAGDHESNLAHALVEIDQRIDAFVALSTDAGDEARTKRRNLELAVSAQVKRFKSDLLAMAGDAANPARRIIAAKALGFSDDPAAVTALCAMLDPKLDSRLLTNATYSLGRIGSPLTRADLLFPLVLDGDPDVRSNALRALARVFEAKRKIGASPLDPHEQRDVMVFLEPALSDPADPLIRAHAAAAVGALGDPRAVDPLIDLLRDPHPLVRMQTAIALGKLGDAKAVPALVKVIDSTPPGTARNTVVLALTALLESLGHRPPDNLGDDGGAWDRWVRANVSNAVKEPSTRLGE
jgi:HEAT repeat protein